MASQFVVTFQFDNTSIIQIDFHFPFEGFLVGYACADTVDAEGGIGAHIEHSRKRLDDLKDDENKHVMEVVWSYETSEDPEVWQYDLFYLKS